VAKKAFWIVLGLAAAAGILGWSTGFLKRSEKDRGEEAATAVVTRRDIGASVRATGIIKPKIGAEVRVGSRASGIVNRLFVRIGDLVRKGDPLAELDATEWEARRDQAAAALETAMTDLRYARIDEKRKQNLAREEYISQADREAAERAAEIAELRIIEAEADLKYFKTQLGFTRIAAPISGVVASVSTQEGETVTAGFATPTFATIIDLGRLEVRAYVDETDIGRIRTGQRGVFTVDTYADVEFEGRVTAIYPKAEIQDNVVNYLVIMEIGDRGDQILRPEMTTSVSIFQETRRGVPAVPRTAVLTESGAKFVFVLDGGRREKRRVRTGWKDEKFVEILEGLREGERVLASVFSPGPDKDSGRDISSGG
jgi:RND family efflux transporter MFP subunit